jgi:hypothetical protein
MGIEDLIFWLFLGFALFSRVFAWIIDRLRGQQPRPPAPAQSEPEDDFFGDDWQDDNWQQREQPAQATPTPAREPAKVVVAQPAPTRPATVARSFDKPALTPQAAANVTAADQGRRLRQQLGLDQRSTLQRSVLLMTVLGPCRANERPSAPQ